MAAISFYKGIDTYLAFAEDTAFGTAGTPAGTDYVDKVTSFTGNLANNMIPVQGIGDGRNATTMVNGVMDCNGSMEWELTDPAFLQYCFVGVVSGAGSLASPYEVAEVDEVGYEATQCPTLTLETGSNGGSNDDVNTYDGVVINTSTINATQGETVKCTAEWIGRTVTSSATALTYTGPTNRPFTFVDGSVTVGSDTVGALTSFSLTTNNNMFVYRTIGSRFINQPVAGVRRYEFSLTMKLHFNDNASVLSGLEARGIVFSGVGTALTPADIAQNTAVALSLDLIEGAANGDRVLNFDLEGCYFEGYSTPVVLEDGALEITITGYGLSGLTDSTAKVPCRWYTIVA